MCRLTIPENPQARRHRQSRGPHWARSMRSCQHLHAVNSRARCGVYRESWGVSEPGTAYSQIRTRRPALAARGEPLCWESPRSSSRWWDLHSSRRGSRFSFTTQLRVTTIQIMRKALYDRSLGNMRKPHSLHLRAYNLVIEKYLITALAFECLLCARHFPCFISFKPTVTLQCKYY